MSYRERNLSAAIVSQSIILALLIGGGLILQSHRFSYSPNSARRDLLKNSPLLFEENVGQADSSYRFLTYGSGYAALLSPEKIELRLFRASETPGRRTRPIYKPINYSSTAVSLNLVGTQPSTIMEGVGRAPATIGYIVGNDPQKWRSEIGQFDRVITRDIYQGIDLVYHGDTGNLEYDFIVRPGADPKIIRFAVDGGRGLHLSLSGDLIIETELGEMRHQKPYIFQEIDGIRREVEGRFVLDASQVVSFEIGAYDRSAPLVIDPVLLYSTYHGLTGADGCTSIAVDDAGDAYITGIRPAVNQLPSAPVLTHVFVRRIDTNRSGAAATKYSVVFGGTTGPSGGGNDAGIDIAIDGRGTVYVTGLTDATNFPVRNALRTTLAGEASAFLIRLDTTLPTAQTLIYSTYLGGTINNDQGPSSSFQAVNIGLGVATDGNGQAFITGFTNATDFPVRNAFLSSFQGGIEEALYGDAFVTRINTNLQGDASLVYSTYLGGSEDEVATDIATDSSGQLYITGATASANFPYRNGLQVYRGGGELGSDAFLTRLDTMKSGAESVIYSTFLAGGRDEAGFGVTVVSDGIVYAAGITNSSDFPIRNGLQGALRGTSPSDTYPTSDAWVTGIDTRQDGNASLLYSTYLGGDGIDGALDIAADAKGFVYVTGGTESKNFPLRDPVRTGLSEAFADPADAFLTKIDPRIIGRDSLIYSTYFGGRDFDIAAGVAVNWTGTAWITGLTNSFDFPLLIALQSSIAGIGEIDLSRFSPFGELTMTAGDGFIAKIGDPVAVVSAASFQATPQPRGAIAAAFGNGFSIESAAATTIPLPTLLAGTSATLTDSSGVDRPVSFFYVSPQQINFLVPTSATLGQGVLTIRRADGRAINGLFTVVAVYPALFAANSTGSGIAAAQVLRVRADGSQIYENVAVFDGPSGMFIAAPIIFGPQSETLFLILFGTGLSGGSTGNATVRVGGVNLTPSFIGPQGSFVGLDQVNVQLPRTLQGAGLVNVAITLNGIASNAVQVRFQ